MGNIRDHDILDRIEKFETPQCRCGNYALRKAHDFESLKCQFLNLEMSLTCQGKCVMCCVGAPDYRGKYDLYEDVAKFVQLLPMSENSPVIYVQGGEILVQPNSLELLEMLKSKLPSSRFWLCTNGNGTKQMRERAVRLFDRFTISVYAFQQETYDSVSGLQLNKTIKFAESLIQSHGKPLNLKYLATPINIHETAIFMKWALTLRPANIQIVDSGIIQYIKVSTDNYWEKIMETTGRKVRESLKLSDRRALRKSETTVLIDPYFLCAFGIDDTFIVAQKLNGIVAPHPNSKK
jgi:pyruvate-formate lyase-activating enzyme